MPHKAVYSQSFELNICITRICSMVRINLAQIYYEYIGCGQTYIQTYTVRAGRKLPGDVWEDTLDPGMDPHPGSTILMTAESEVGCIEPPCW